MDNKLCCPTFEILNTSINFGVYEILMRQLLSNNISQKVNGKDVLVYGRLHGNWRIHTGTKCMLWKRNIFSW